MTAPRRMTPEERAHLNVIETWSQQTHAAFAKIRAMPMFNALRKVIGKPADQDTVLDHVDWLVAVLKQVDPATVTNLLEVTDFQRAKKRPTAGDLVRSVEAYQRLCPGCRKLHDRVECHGMAIVDGKAVPCECQCGGGR